MRYLRAAVIILGLLPVGFIVPLLSFYFHACWELGCRPSYDNPDPKVVSGYTAYSPVVFNAFVIWFYTFLPWLIATATYSTLNWKSQKNWAFVKISVFTQLVCLMMFLTGIVEWFMD